ncbi:MAG: AAA family ATPase [Parcubacteria group bacterium]|nr:AAA family ATPase [Parcubacteria group bacterium]
MDICGHRDKIEFFENLLENGALGHAYLFFGEPHVGKFTFAKALAKQWDSRSLETLVVEPNENGGVGIDDIKTARRFAWQKPIFAPRRTVIINEMETLTDEAQNALLKMAEEPPPSVLIIGVISDSDLLFPTLNSRFQKLHFGRPTTNEITDYLSSKFKLAKKDALAAAERSLGRPGRVILRLNDKKTDKIERLAEIFITKENQRSKIIDSLLDADTDYEERQRLNIFFEHLIINLRQNLGRNWRTLRFLGARLRLMREYQTNKRLQLEAIAQFL